MNCFFYQFSGNAKGWTPLHWAAGKGQFEICKLIIENVLQKNPPDMNGKTPLHCAASSGHLEICKLIMRNIRDTCPVAGLLPDYSGYIPWATNPEIANLFQNSTVHLSRSYFC